MSLNLHNSVRKNFSLRLTVWYTAVSILAYMLLFAIAYYSILSSLKKEDQRVVLSKYKEYVGEYLRDGVSGIEMSINAERDDEKPINLFVRIASENNYTLFLSLPDQWAGIDLAQIKNITVHKKEHRIKISAKGYNSVFEITTFSLEDGNFLQIGKEINHREEILERFKKVFTGVMILAILISLTGGYIIIFRSLQPIRNLTKTVESIIDTGKMEDRVPAGKTDDELNKLVRLFNLMLERIENLIGGMKESLDNVAHELKTPMTRLRGIAEDALQKEENHNSYREALSDCLEESERIIKMLNTIMDISEAKAGTLNLDIKQIDVSTLVEEVVELYRYIADEKNIVISTDCKENIHLMADEDRLKQILGNLLDNAVKYTPAGGRIDVEASQKAGQIFIVIKDTGIGIRQEDLAKIWDRFYRTEEGRTQRGLGLGLSIVKSLVELHGGHVDVASKPGSGTTFTLYLPQTT